MKRILWLPLVLALLGLGCAGTKKEIKREEIVLPITQAEIRQALAAPREPKVVRQEIIPLPQVIPLPLAKRGSPKPEKSIPKELPPVAEVRRTKAETREVPLTHLVKKGECLWRISRRYYQNIYLWPIIARANHLFDPYVIYPGDKLTIPAIIPTKFAVKRVNRSEKVQPEEQFPKLTPVKAKQVAISKAYPKNEAEGRPKLWQEIGGNPYQGTWQEAINKFNLPGPIKEEVKKNIKEDKFQWLEKGLTSGQKLSQLVLGKKEVWNDVLCYWSFYQSYPVKDYGTEEYRVIQVSACGNWAWWKEEPRGPPKELAALKELSALRELSSLKKELSGLREVLAKKKEKVSFPWTAAILWATVILLAVLIVIARRKTNRKIPEGKGG